MRHLPSIAAKIRQAETALEGARGLMLAAIKAGVRDIGHDEVLALAEAQHKTGLIYSIVNNLEKATYDLPEMDDDLYGYKDRGYIP